MNSEDKKSMKSGEIIDALLEYRSIPIEIELPNGNRLTTACYRHDTNKRGEPVIVIRAGKEKGKN